MATMKDYEVFTRIGTQSDRTTIASAFLEADISLGGLGLGTTKGIQEVETEHRYEGNKHRYASSRNLEAGNVQTPLYPNIAGTIMNGIVRSSGQLTYHTIEQWWDTTLTGSAVGRRFYGVIMDSLSFTLDRTGEGQAVVADISCYQNSNEELTSGLPASYSGSPEIPYVSTDALIDLVPNGDTSDFGADNADVLSLTFNFSNNTVVKNVRSSTTARLNLTWTTQTPRTPTLTVDATLEMTDSAYLSAHDASGITEGALRIAIKHPSASLSTTSTDTVAAGDNNTQTIDLVASTGAVVGDTVIMEDPDVGFVVHEISGVDTVGTDITIETDTAGGELDAYVALDGGTGDAITVTNMGIGIIVPRLVLTSPLNNEPQDGDRVVNMSFSASLLSGETTLMTVLAYNHDTTTHA